MEQRRIELIKKWLKFSLWIVIPVICWFIFLNIIYLNSKTTCAKFTKEGNTRGTIYIHYLYEVEGEEYIHLIDLMFLKVKSLEELKRVECVEIEYSVWFPNFSRVTDKRVIK